MSTVVYKPTRFAWYFKYFCLTYTKPSLCNCYAFSAIFALPAARQTRNTKRYSLIDFIISFAKNEYNTFYAPKRWPQSNEN